MTSDTLPDTRTRLLLATAELIWAGSFHASGVDEICRKADVRKGSFYHFFPSKTDLAIEALRLSWATVRATVFEPIFDGDGRGLARIDAIIDAVDRVQREEAADHGVYLGCPFGSLGQEMAHQDERLREEVDAIFEGHLDYFERALEEAVDDGEIMPGNLRDRARSILALMEGALLVAKVANVPERFGQATRAMPALASGVAEQARGDLSGART